LTTLPFTQVRHPGCASVGWLKGSAEAEAAVAGEPRPVELSAQCTVPPEALAAAFSNSTDAVDRLVEPSTLFKLRTQLKPC
jgi:hypothetical protein